MTGTSGDIALDLIRPNSWNPNQMDDAMYAKELASIRRYGFVDPLIVREIHHPMGIDFWYEIIDGEHRWRAAREVGMSSVPVWNLGQLDDDTARELTIVLNETRGQADRQRLSALLVDLASRRDENSLREVMPFSHDKFDELMGKMRIDWQALEDQRKTLTQNSSRWVERIFRMPADAAEVLDEALSSIMEQEELHDQWRALEFLAADYSSK